ncbi:DUF4129 domain-containing protein [Salinirubrum litoreum]|uniref:DUF4129 domain-containing protein n=1 Tax=Salinirubrum litoreum TaxID=1126234 RepID=A0ABD5R902_9EURY
MAYDRQRAALALLCVVAVLFGASLFPATGFGSYPSRDAGGPTLPGDPTGGTETPVSTPTPTPTDPGDETTDTPTPTDTPEPNATATDTPIPPDTGDAPSLNWGAILWLFALGGGSVLLLAGVRHHRGRRYPLLGLLPIDEARLPDGGLPALLAELPRQSMLFVLGVGTSLSPTVDALSSLADGVGSALSAGGRGIARGLEVAVVGVPSALAQGLGGLGRGLDGLFSLSGALASIGSGVTSRNWGSDDDERSSAGAGTDPDQEPVDPGPPDIEEAWDAMTDEVRVRHRRAATPADFARAAVEQGFPADAVETLTTVFREVRYGDYPSSELRVQSAREAIAAIRQHLEVRDS